jgi:hypothetical protein
MVKKDNPKNITFNLGSDIIPTEGGAIKKRRGRKKKPIEVIVKETLPHEKFARKHNRALDQLLEANREKEKKELEKSLKTLISSKTEPKQNLYGYGMKTDELISTLKDKGITSTKGRFKHTKDIEVDIPIVGKVELDIPPFFAIKKKKGWRLVNPLTEMRNIASRRGVGNAIQLRRANVEDPELKVNDDGRAVLPTLGEFSKKDQDKLLRYYNEIKSGKDNAYPFKNAPRGFPATLYKNAERAGLRETSKKVYTRNSLKPKPIPKARGRPKGRVYASPEPQIEVAIERHVADKEKEAEDKRKAEEKEKADKEKADKEKADKEIEEMRRKRKEEQSEYKERGNMGETDTKTKEKEIERRKADARKYAEEQEPKIMNAPLPKYKAVPEDFLKTIKSWGDSFYVDKEPSEGVYDKLPNALILLWGYKDEEVEGDKEPHRQRVVGYKKVLKRHSEHGFLLYDIDFDFNKILKGELKHKTNESYNPRTEKHSFTEVATPDLGAYLKTYSVVERGRYSGLNQLAELPKSLEDFITRRIMKQRRLKVEQLHERGRGLDKMTGGASMTQKGQSAEARSFTKDQLRVFLNNVVHSGDLHPEPSNPVIDKTNTYKKDLEDEIQLGSAVERVSKDIMSDPKYLRQVPPDIKAELLDAPKKRLADNEAKERAIQADVEKYSRMIDTSLFDDPHREISPDVYDRFTQPIKDRLRDNIHVVQLIERINRGFSGNIEPKYLFKLLPKFAKDRLKANQQAKQSGRGMSGFGTHSVMEDEETGVDRGDSAEGGGSDGEKDSKGDGLLGKVGEMIYKRYIEPKKKIAHAITHPKETFEKAKQMGKDIIYGRMDYPPHAREILDKYGNEEVIDIDLHRKVLSVAYTGLLNVLTKGEFDKRVKEQPKDKLFHISMWVKLKSGTTILVEKNEVITMKVSPKANKEEEQQPVDIKPPAGLKFADMFEKALKRYGESKFFSYSAKDNNCGNFIEYILRANDMESQATKDFIGQDAKAILEGFPKIRKFMNTLTDIAGRANVVLEGGELSDRDFESSDSDSGSDCDSGRGLVRRRFNVNNVVSRKKLSHTKYIMPTQGGRMIGLARPAVLPAHVGHPALVSDQYPRIPQAFTQVHLSHPVPIGHGLYAGGGGLGGAMYAPAHLIGGERGVRHIQGGDIWGDIGRAFDPKKNGVAKALDPNQNGVSNAFKSTFTPQLGRDIASTLIHKGLPIVGQIAGSTLGNVLAPELGGVGGFALGQAGKAGGNALGDYIGKETGYGLGGKLKRPHMVKGSAEAKAYMASIRKKKGSKGGRIPAPPSRSPITDPSLL